MDLNNILLKLCLSALLVKRSHIQTQDDGAPGPKKTGNDFIKSLDAINLSVLKTHCIRWEDHSSPIASCVSAHFFHRIALGGDGCYCSLIKEETGAQKGEPISSRSNGTPGTAAEQKLFKHPSQGGLSQPHSCPGILGDQQGRT